MTVRITYVERKPSEAVSIERVFRQVAGDLPTDLFQTKFQNVPFGNGIGAIVKNLLFYRREPSDIYHITGDVHYISLRLPPERTVLTIHDLIFLHRRSGLRRSVLKKLFLDIPVKRCARITAVSQATKDEIIKYTGIAREKITVIENPVFDAFMSGGKDRRFNAERPVILHIGTAENKNLANLIEAVREIPCKLRIVGKLDDKILKRLGELQTVFENVHGLDERQMVDEYDNADIVAFCSSYEGFGLPILEAQMMKRPVVTSDLAPMNSVAGGGAALADPYDVTSITNALKRVIDDERYREQLIAKGTVNVELYRAKAIAQRYATVYGEILSGASAV